MCEKLLNGICYRERILNVIREHENHVAPIRIPIIEISTPIHSKREESVTDIAVLPVAVHNVLKAHAFRNNGDDPRYFAGIMVHRQLA